MSHRSSKYQFVGKPFKVVDGKAKISGTAVYTADFSLPNMGYIGLVFSPYAQANIKAIETTNAANLPGVIAVLTADDLVIPYQLPTSRNNTLLAKDKVLFYGQPVVAVVAESAAFAEDAIELIFIDYEPLPTVTNVEQAFQPDTPAIWEHQTPNPQLTASSRSNVHNESHFRRGDITQGFTDADVIVEKTYCSSSLYQGYMEPHAVVVEPNSDADQITIYTSTQMQFVVRDGVAQTLGLPASHIRVVAMAIGGGFGAKRGIFEALVAAIALTLKRPVQLVLSRLADMCTTTPFSAMTIHLKTGVTMEGNLTALEGQILVDSGIFPYSVHNLAAVLLGSYYKFPHLQIDLYEVITNNPPAGAYRAPSGPMATFAIESNMDDMAAAIQYDPITFRYQNAVETGDLMVDGKRWSKINLKTCLNRLREHPLWQTRQTLADYSGVGIAVGGWWLVTNPVEARCRIDADSRVSIYVGSVDISGVNSSLTLVAAEILTVSPEKVSIVQEDTNTAPYAGPSGASRTTYTVAAAVSQVSEAAKQQLLSRAAEQFEVAEYDLVLQDGYVQVKGAPPTNISIGDLAKTSPIVAVGNSDIQHIPHNFAVHAVAVDVDPETGSITPTAYVAIHDVGFALNPLMVEGQIHGGVVQGLGIGLFEQMVYDDGTVISGTFMDYALPKAVHVPNIEVILLQNPSKHGPFGAKGVGELPIVPVAGAVGNAIKAATNVRLTNLPMQSEILWEILHENE